LIKLKLTVNNEYKDYSIKIQFNYKNLMNQFSINSTVIEMQDSFNIPEPFSSQKEQIEFPFE